MRYLLIDHITEWKPAEIIKGIKNVAMSEDFLEFHFPRNPIMPGVLLLESMVQLAAWLEAASSDFQNWFFVSKVGKANFYSFALPGDQVILEVQGIADNGPGLKRYRGTGTVMGKKKIIAEFEGETAPLDEFENAADQKELFLTLTRKKKL